ncbi:MAG: hypothetical protein EBY26_06780, partial [Microbacteriaceae bacterium]|nr:hypothetical protein [Microbacteriaceae bacterium]
MGSLVDAAGGNDELFNTESQGGNQLVGGLGSDDFFLKAGQDVVIGGRLLADPASLGLPPVIALVDQEVDQFLIDSSDPAGVEPLRILDYEPGIDKLLLDGVVPQGDWLAVRQQLQGLNVAINAAPQLTIPTLAITLNSGTETTKDLGAYCVDLDADNLQIVKLEGPDWLSVSGLVLKATVPAQLTKAQLAATKLVLGISDGKAVTSFSPSLILNSITDINGPPTAVALTNTTTSLAENSNTTNRIKVADIVISDDAIGSNTISLQGSDAASFEVVGNSLYLKAGVELNY